MMGPRDDSTVTRRPSLWSATPGTASNASTDRRIELALGPGETRARRADVEIRAQRALQPFAQGFAEAADHDGNADHRRDRHAERRDRDARAAERSRDGAERQAQDGARAGGEPRRDKGERPQCRGRKCRHR